MINPFITTFVYMGEMYSQHEIVEVRLGTGDWVQRRLAHIDSDEENPNKRIFCFDNKNHPKRARWTEIRKRDGFRQHPML